MVACQVDMSSSESEFQLPDEAGKVVVLKILGQQRLGELVSLPTDEPANRTDERFERHMSEKLGRGLSVKLPATGLRNLERLSQLMTIDLSISQPINSQSLGPHMERAAALSESRPQGRCEITCGACKGLPDIHEWAS